MRSGSRGCSTPGPPDGTVLRSMIPVVQNVSRHCVPGKRGISTSGPTPILLLHRKGGTRCPAWIHKTRRGVSADAALSAAETGMD